MVSHVFFYFAYFLCILCYFCFSVPCNKRPVAGVRYSVAGAIHFVYALWLGHAKHALRLGHISSGVVIFTVVAEDIHSVAEWLAL